METKLTIRLPVELSRRAKARAALQGTTLSEIIRKRLEDFADGLDQDFDKTKLYRKLTPEEIAADMLILKELQAIGEEISKTWPQDISAADAIKEQRREL